METTRHDQGTPGMSDDGEPQATGLEGKILAYLARFPGREVEDISRVLERRGARYESIERALEKLLAEGSIQREVSRVMDFDYCGAYTQEIRYYVTETT